MDLILYSIAVFVFGMVTAKIFGGITSLGISASIVKGAMKASLEIIGYAITDMSYIKQLKVLTLQETGAPEHKIEAAKILTEQEFKYWKQRYLNDLRRGLTPRYEYLMNFNTWDEAMEKLNEIYKT
tara:strand:- start:183 stop:560 length:378 start_codon:yes stop_codon:yes gene_type:complete